MIRNKTSLLSVGCFVFCSLLSACYFSQNNNEIKDKYDNINVIRNNRQLSLYPILENSTSINKSEEIKRIIEAGGNVNEKDDRGWIPLYYVVFHSLDNNDAINTKTLLSYGANANYTISETGNTMASAISSKCNDVALEQLKALHENGFSLNTRIFSPEEYYGANPTLLMTEIVSAINDKKCLRIVKYILDQNIDVNAINYVHGDNDHQSSEEANALFYALDFENKAQNIDPKNVLEIVTLLISKGINTEFINNNGHNAIYFLKNNPILKNSLQYKELKDLLTKYNKGGQLP